MDWYDVEDVLYDGTNEQIDNLKCPDCGEKISYIYNKECNSLTIECKKCGYVSKGHGCSKIPNCANF